MRRLATAVIVAPIFALFFLTIGNALVVYGVFKSGEIEYWAVPVVIVGMGCGALGFFLILTWF